MKLCNKIFMLKKELTFIFKQCIVLATLYLCFVANSRFIRELNFRGFQYRVLFQNSGLRLVMTKRLQKKYTHITHFYYIYNKRNFIRAILRQIPFYHIGIDKI